MENGLPGEPQAAEGEQAMEENTADDPAVGTGNGDNRSVHKGTEEVAASKRQNQERPFEEERMERLELEGDGLKEGGGSDDVTEAGGDEKGPSQVSVGPKVFTSSVEMFDYFYKLLHAWSPNLHFNKYEHLVLLDLVKKGHSEPAKMIGPGILAFQVRYHPVWKSRRYFLIRVDSTVDDFSFRQCVDKLLPLPDNMKCRLTSSDIKTSSDKKTRSHQRSET